MQNDEKLLNEAYKQIYESVDQTNALQRVLQAFQKLGWKGQITNGGKDGIVEFTNDRGVKYDLYFYPYQNTTIEFYGHAIMPWDNSLKDNEIQIEFEKGHDGYGILMTGDIDADVDTIISKTLQMKLPSGPTPDDETFYRQGKQADKDYDSKQ